MKKIYAVFLFVMPLLLGKAIVVKAQVDINDSLALVDLYNSTDGPHWAHHDNWLTTKPVSQWYGVLTIANNVYYLQLPNNNLKGTLPLDFTNLRPRVLNLSYNELSGNIPVWKASNSFFDTLNLSNNNFAGHIPDSIQGNNFNLSFNNLTGTVPKFGGAQIHSLNLSHNKLSGVIPKNIFAEEFMTALDLSYNNLTGEIAYCRDLSYIQYFYLNDNKLSGAIPTSLGTRSSLIELDLSNNKLSGTIPNIHAAVEVLSLFHNQLTGNISSSFQNLNFLKKLDISANRLSGTVPSYLATLPKLTHLNVVYNHFTFDGIETLAQHNFQKFIYRNEKHIDIHQNGNILSTYAGGTLSNNTYKWFKDGNLVSTVTGDSTYTPTTNGAYNVAVTNSIATELTLYSDTINFATGKVSSAVTSSLSINNFSIYPNPAKTVVNVSFAGAGNYTIQLSDISGQILQTKTINAIKGVNTFQLNLSNYVPGIYFVTLLNDLKQSQTLRVKKQ